MALTVMTIPVFARVGTTEIQIGTITVDFADTQPDADVKISDEGIRMVAGQASGMFDVPDGWAFNPAKGE